MKNNSNSYQHLNHFIKHVAFVLLAFLILAGTSRAQDFGTVQGKVVNVHSGDPLVNANIMLAGSQLGAASDRNGEFIINRVPLGTYQLKVTFIGYEPFSSSIIVSAGDKVVIEAKLREDFFHTQQVVVTATRTQKLMENVPVVTELVSQAEIAEKGAENLSEILADRPGIAIESGSSGERFLYMNGVDSRRITVLVDNVPIAGKLNSRIPLDLIDSDKIGHIEIIKGPSSALYGSDAMGGVIHIITRDYSPGFRILGNGRAGSDDRYSGNLSLSGTLKNLNYFFSGDHFRQGFDKGAAEIDVTDTQTSSASSKIRYNAGSLGSLELKGEFREDEQASESQFMGGYSDNTARVTHYTSSAVWNKAFSPGFNMLFTGFYSDNFRTYKSARRNSTRPASIDTTTDAIYGFKTDLTVVPISRAKLDVGFDFSSNDYDNQRLASSQNRKQFGSFAQLETNPFDKLTLIVGGRYDKITDIDGSFSPRFSVLYDLKSSLKLRGSFGIGFRAPSFIEQYSNFPMPIPGVPIKVVGNPDLKPEKSAGGNLGLEYLWNSDVLLNFTLFQNRFKDMIVDYQADRSTYSYLNVASATIRGLELQTALYLLNNLTTTLSYNYTAIDHQEENVALSKISPHTAAVRIVYGLFKNKFKLSMRNQYFSDRDILVVSGQTGGFVKVKKTAYNEIDLTFSYKLNDLFTWMLGANNLTDYVDENYGPYVGRRVFINIQTGFQRN